MIAYPLDYAMSWLHDVHLFHVTLLENLAGGWVFDGPCFDASNFLVHIQQALLPVNPTVRQNDWITFDVALRVMCIGHVPCQLIQFG